MLLKVEDSIPHRGSFRFDSLRPYVNDLIEARIESYDDHFVLRQGSGPRTEIYSERGYSFAP